MPREKMHRVEKTKVNHREVRELLKMQHRRNQELGGSSCCCDLKPHKDKEACATCTCFAYCSKGMKLEHKDIAKKASKKAAKRRKRRQDCSKRKVDPAWVEPKEDSLESQVLDYNSSYEELDEMFIN